MSPWYDGECRMCYFTIIFPLLRKFVFWTNYVLNALDSFGQNFRHRWFGARKISLATIFDLLQEECRYTYRLFPHARLLNLCLI